MVCHIENLIIESKFTFFQFSGASILLSLSGYCKSINHCLYIVWDNFSKFVIIFSFNLILFKIVLYSFTIFLCFSINGTGSLDSIINFKNGKKVGAEAGDIPVYGGNGILGYTKEFNAENGTAIGRVGAYCGMSYREFNKMWISDNGIFARDKEGLNNYAFYLISNLNLNERAEGTGQPLITQNMLNNISISVPPKKLREEFDCMIGKILTLINIKKREIKMMNVIKEINLSMISK